MYVSVPLNAEDLCLVNLCAFLRKKLSCVCSHVELLGFVSYIDTSSV